MRSLLDVNVLIALLDAQHALHERAIAWFAQHGPSGWASCPVTQNGCLRVISSAGYAKPLPVSLVRARLIEACATVLHEFWSDEISLLDDSIVDGSRILGPRQVTDIYLLALAVRRGGRLVTFDRAVPLAAVRGARPEHLLAL